MFRKRSAADSLPFSGPQTSAARPSRKALSWAVLGSVVWLILSLGTVVYGVRKLGQSNDVRTVNCTEGGPCAISTASVDDGETTAQGDLVNAELVRLRRGRVVDTRRLKAKQMRKLGYSYTVTVRDVSGKESTHIMSFGTLGRKVAKKKYDLAVAYIADVKAPRDGAAPTLDLRQSSGVSAVGILLIIYGCFSLLFCVILGQFSESPPPSRPAPGRRPPPRRPAAAPGKHY
ncbi:hypothetical protein M885DRAFT_521353 [Pelagophyceae sp. CCMP2097]|nr:hypothetical protein M885DRAFT_521353 [Pelagophyceae sp. CCMP2097]